MGIFVQVILFIIMNWASIYSIVTLILELLKENKDKSAVKEGRVELIEAIKEFKSTGDKKRLEKLLCRLEKNCRSTP